MGTTLTGSQINNTYDGLIKTTDNTALSATTKLISDGLGNDSCIKVGTAGTDFLGNVDFSAATVTGLSDNNTTYDLASAQAGANVNVNLTGSDATTDTVTLAAGTNITLTDNGSCQITIDSTSAAGLVSGTGTNSMKNADSLVTNPATASGGCSIALGDGASAAGNFTIAIGCGSSASLISGTAVGALATASSAATALGNAANAAGGTSVSLGDSSDAIGDSSIAIGYTANATATCAVAIGRGVTAATADTVSVKALETQTASTPTAGGIIMTDAGSTARRLNITAAGALQIDSTPVGGGGGAAGLVSGTGTDSMKNADSLVTNPASADWACSIALGDAAVAGRPTTGTATPVGEIAIGLGANTGALASANYYTGGSIAIGQNACTTNRTDYSFAPGRGNIAIGFNSLACGNGDSGATALGLNTDAIHGGTVAIGCGACASTENAVAIGNQSCNSGPNSLALGNSSRSSAYMGISIGSGACAAAGGFPTGAVAIGAFSRGDALCSGAFGACSCAGGLGTYAIGYNVRVTRPDTVVGCQMEACVAGKGIVVTSPDGLTTLGIGIDNTGAIVTYTP